MTFVGWSQIAIVLALTLIAAIPLSGLIVNDLRGRGQLPHAGPAAGRARVLSPRRRRRDARAELARLRDGDDRLLDRRLPVALRAAAAAERAAAQSAEFRRRAVRSRLQHLDQLHHQHQLAELRRRDDDEPSDPDARPHRPQFPLRRDRPRHGLRAGARLRALDRDDGRQFLGRYDPRRALRPAAAVDRHRAGLRRARRAADARRLGRRHDARRRQADDLASGRWRARRRSRSSAPTAAAS